MNKWYYFLFHEPRYSLFGLHRVSQIKTWSDCTGNQIVWDQIKDVNPIQSDLVQPDQILSYSAHPSQYPCNFDNKNQYETQER